ncbi:hypothetical protein [Paracoccus sp. KR1-242]|uniref:hypothetical protein n=1 Tax=Paracoccus sp. KR1-242 TaxID=3410028 RepID=UPI003C11C8A4
MTLFRAPGGSSRVVVCFEPGRERMQGFEPTQCPRFAERLGIDALTVQTARRDWFLSAKSDDLAAALDRATAGYDEVTASGFSMGGYGALLYSRAARVSRILAVSPQYCIDPAIAPYDPGRHRKFARIGRDMPCPEQWGNPGISGVLLFDPSISADRQHALRIGAAFPLLRLVALPHGGHPASGVIADIGRIGNVSTMLVQDRLDPVRIRNLHREARRNSIRYSFNLASAALKRHGARVEPLLRDVALRGAPQLRLEAGLALLTRDAAAGTEALTRLLDENPDPPASWARRIEQALDAIED